MKRRFSKALQPANEKDLKPKAYSGLRKVQERKTHFPEFNIAHNLTPKDNSIEKRQRRLAHFLPTKRPYQFKVAQFKADNTAPVLLSKTAQVSATPDKEKIRRSKNYKLAKLPSYRPLKTMVDGIVADEKTNKPTRQAKITTKAVKMARAHPVSKEAELLDFLPVKHIYKPAPKKPSQITPKAAPIVMLPPKEENPLPPSPQQITKPLPNKTPLEKKAPVSVVARQVLPASQPNVTSIPKHHNIPLPIKRMAQPTVKTPDAPQLKLASLPAKRVQKPTQHIRIRSVRSRNVKRKYRRPVKARRRLTAALKRQRRQTVRLIKRRQFARNKKMQEARRQAALQRRNTRRTQRRQARSLRTKRYASQRKLTRRLTRLSQSRLKQRRQKKINKRQASYKKRRTIIPFANLLPNKENTNQKRFKRRVKKRRIASYRKDVLRRKLRQQRKKASQKYIIKKETRRPARRLAQRRLKTISRASRSTKRLKRKISQNKRVAFRDRIRRKNRTLKNKTRNKKILTRIGKKLKKKRIVRRRVATSRVENRAKIKARAKARNKSSQKNRHSRSKPARKILKKRTVTTAKNKKNKRLRRTRAAQRRIKNKVKKRTIRQRTAKKRRKVRKTRRTRVARRVVKKRFGVYNLDGTFD